MSYGNYWEKYPIEDGETYTFGASKICVSDITKRLPDFMLAADMIYSDTPWSLGNINMFNSKAGREHMAGFAEFYTPLFSHIKRIAPRVCYLEIGKQELGRFRDMLGGLYGVVQQWEIVYYNKYPCYLLRGGASAIDFDFIGMDDAETPRAAVRADDPAVVGDFCTGRGLTGLAALGEGKRFVGCEMNKRKLAVFIHRARQAGFVFRRE